MPTTLFYGPMKCGKSRSLIRAYHAHLERDPAHFFLYSFGPDYIRTRAEEDDIPAIVLSDDTSLVRMMTDVIHALQGGELVICFFDEVQFSTPLFPEICRELSNLGAYIYLAGLDTDFRRELFPPMQQLMEEAEHVHQFHSECDQCGEPSSFTQRLLDGQPVTEGELVVLDSVHGGENDYTYETRCERCYVS